MWQIRKECKEALLIKTENPLKRSTSWNCDPALFVSAGDSLFNRFFTKLYKGNLINYPFMLQVTADTQRRLTCENNCICFDMLWKCNNIHNSCTWKEAASNCPGWWHKVTQGLRSVNMHDVTTGQVGWHYWRWSNSIQCCHAVYVSLKEILPYFGGIYQYVNCSSLHLQTGGQNVISKLMWNTGYLYWSQVEHP